MEDDHLKPHTTDRGFHHLPPIKGVWGGRPDGSEVRAYESSLASGPHLWISVLSPVDANEPDGPKTESIAHLTAENTLKLAEQLYWLVENHYQIATGPQEADDDERI